jgi:molybdopterin-binding protein
VCYPQLWIVYTKLAALAGLHIGLPLMTAYRIADAARLLGVSDDTLRRWVEGGRVPAHDEGGRRVIDGADLARFANEQNAGAVALEAGPIVGASARNRFTGIVTRVVKDTVMAQVEIAAGPFRVVSLMSAEAATELGLEPGVLAVASVKSTNVVVEVPVQP